MEHNHWTLPYDPEDVEDVLQRHAMAVLHYAALGDTWAEPLLVLSPCLSVAQPKEHHLLQQQQYPPVWNRMG